MEWIGKNYFSFQQKENEIFIPKKKKKIWWRRLGGSKRALYGMSNVYLSVASFEVNKYNETNANSVYTHNAIQHINISIKKTSFFFVFYIDV